MPHANRKTRQRRTSQRNVPKNIETTALLFSLEELSVYARQAEIEAIKQGLTAEAKALKQIQKLNGQIYRRAGGLSA